MLISAIMSVYDEPDYYIKSSIESILNQSFRDFEFIIIQDTPDNNRITLLLNEYVNKDKRVRYICNDQNIGLAQSLNKGLKIANGEYIARMDADDISLSNRFQHQIDFLEQNPEISLVGSSAVLVDENGLELQLLQNPTEHEYLRLHFLKGFTPCFHPTWMFRKKLLENLGGYRNLPVGQDYDFLARLMDYGLKISNLKEPLLEYREHPGRIGNNKNIVQIRLGEYIRRIYEKGKINDDSFFSGKAISSLTEVSPILNSFHMTAQGITRKARTYKGQSTYLYYFFLIVAGIISPYQFYYMAVIAWRHSKYHS